jgi:tetratricopeptide (TPR) repeat protein/tRNA A-37 threonylcarbamoyl transferase component Bud32
MAHCPPPDALQDLLAGVLTDAEAGTCRSHLAECRHCQSIMDRLTDHPDLCQWVADADDVTPLPLDTPPLRRLLEALRAPPVAVANPAGDARPFMSAAATALGQYRIVAELGHGGMGIVLKAFDPALARTVAVKVLRRECADGRARARFVREARAAAGLNHDHVVPVFTVENPPDGPPYLVMPFVPGPTLRERIRAERRLDPREAARVCAEVADGLAAAHAAGLVHRDIKPANVILDSEHGRARIVDFGLVRVMEGSAETTQEGAIAGTPEYMSPEQVREPDRIDARTDIYSLGVTLYESLTGEPPFRGVPHMVLQQVLHDEPIRPRRISDRIPRDLETICLKAIANEPSRRYQTVVEVRDDLRRFLAGEPIRARPVGRVERSWRWARRRPLVASLTAAVVLAVLAGVGGVLWQWSRAEERRELAQKRLSQIESANKVLAGIFRDVDPWEEEKGGPTLRVQLGERLNQAATQIEGEAIGDPLTVARLQMALGHSQRGLGYAQEAVALLEKARESFETHGGDKIEILDCLHDLARAYQAAGQHDRALSLFEETLTRRKETLGPDDPETLNSMNSLAGVYWHRGQHELATPLYEETLAKRRQILGPDHTDTIKSMNNLANAYIEGGQYGRALTLHEQALAKLEAKLGPEHPHTLHSLNNVANLLRITGQIDRGVPLLEQSLAKRRKTFGPDHPETLTSMNNLAMGYQTAGQPDRALPLLEETLAKRSQKLGPDHHHTLLSMNNLADAYKHSGRPEKAVPLLEQAVGKMQETLAPNHPHTLAAMSNLAYVYQTAGQLDRAVPLFEETLERFQAKLGCDHPSTLNVMVNLGLAYQAAGQIDRAERLLEQAVERQKQKPGPDHPATLSGMQSLARVYRAAGKLDQALSLFEETYQKRQAKLGAKHPDTVLSLGDLGVANLAAKRSELGLPLLHDFASRQRERLGPENPRLAAALASVGENLLKYDQPAEAEPVLRECLAIRQVAQPDDWSAFHAQTILGESLLGQKKYADAERLLVQGYDGMKKREAKMPATSKRRFNETAQLLMRLYEATGEREQLAAWRQRLEVGKTQKSRDP